MSNKCSTCQHYNLFIMIQKPYAYAGDIPCIRCKHFLSENDEYVERIHNNDIVKNYYDINSFYTTGGDIDYPK